MEKLDMRTFILAPLLALSCLGTGCAAYKMKTPTGFARVSETKHMVHYKGRDDVGLNVRVFGNVDGGTLSFWTDDLTDKLSRRGYNLERATELTSKNGVPGQRLDFTYAPDESTNKSYSVVVFATDAHRVVVQLAGDPEPQAKHGKKLDQVASQMKIRGCKVRSEICRG
jgi:hypothetical protein